MAPSVSNSLLKPWYLIDLDPFWSILINEIVWATKYELGYELRSCQISTCSYTNEVVEFHVDQLCLSGLESWFFSWKVENSNNFVLNLFVYLGRALSAKILRVLTRHARVPAERLRLAGNHQRRCNQFRVPSLNDWVEDRHPELCWRRTKNDRSSSCVKT